MRNHVNIGQIESISKADIVRICSFAFKFRHKIYIICSINRTGTKSYDYAGIVCQRIFESYTFHESQLRRRMTASHIYDIRPDDKAFEGIITVII